MKPIEKDHRICLCAFEMNEFSVFGVVRFNSVYIMHVQIYHIRRRRRHCR